MEPGERHGSHDGAPSPAIRTIATPWADHAIRQIQQQFHRAAMAGSPMPGVYDRITHCLETHPQAPGPWLLFVIPAQAGIHCPRIAKGPMDSRFYGNDGKVCPDHWSR
jgi:hypothetical protein